MNDNTKDYDKSGGQDGQSIPTEHKNGDKPTKRKRRFLKYLLIVFVIFIAVIIILPAVISSEKGNSFVLNRINNSISGKFAFDKLTIGWFKGIEIKKPSFSDDKGGIKFNAEKIKTHPSFWSLFKASLNLGQTLIDKPEIEITLNDEDGNYLSDFNAQEKHALDIPQTVPREDYSAQNNPLAALAAVTNIQLRINDGRVSVENHLKEKLTFDNLYAKADLKGINKNNTFDISTKISSSTEAETALASVNGNIYPAVENRVWSLKKTNGKFSIKINALNLSSLQPLFDITDFDTTARGLINADVVMEMAAGKIKTLIAKADGKDINIELNSNGDVIKTKKLLADIKISETKSHYNFEKLNLTSDWLTINGNGNISSSNNTDTNSEFNATFNFDLAKASQNMPATFAVKKDVTITKANLAGNVLYIAKNNRQSLITKVSLDKLQANTGDSQFGLNRPMSADINIENDNRLWKINKAVISSSFINAELTGSIDNLKYDITSDLSKIQQQFGQLFNINDYYFSGIQQQKGSAVLKDDILYLTGQTELNNFVFGKGPEKINEKHATINYGLAIKTESKSTNIKSLNYDGTLGKFNITDSSIDYANNNSKIKINADFNIEKLLPLAKIFDAIDKQYYIKGKADATADIQIDNNIINVKTTNARIASPVVVYKNEVIFEQDYITVDFEGEFDSLNKDIDIKNIKIDSPDVKIIKGQLTKKQYQIKSQTKEKLSGNFIYDVNLAQVGNIAKPFMSGDFEIQGREKQNLTFKSIYQPDNTDDMLANLNAKASLNFDQAKYMGMNFGKTRAKIEIANGLMEIEPFTTTVNNGKLNFSAVADLTQKPIILKTNKQLHLLNSVSITREMAGEMLQFLNPVFANIVSINGILNFNCEKLEIPLASGNTENITVIGTVDINDIILTGKGLITEIMGISGHRNSPTAKLHLLPTYFTLTKGLLHYDDMPIDFGRDTVNFSGDISLGKQIAMKVALPWSLTGKKIHNSDTTNNKIVLNISGSVDNPQINTDRLIEEAGRKILQEQLDNALDKLFK